MISKLGCVALLWALVSAGNHPTPAPVDPTCGPYAKAQTLTLLGNTKEPVVVVRLVAEDLSKPELSRIDPNRAANSLARDAACAVFRLEQAAANEKKKIEIESGFRSFQFQELLDICRANPGHRECQGIDTSLSRESPGESLFGNGFTVKFKLTDPTLDAWLLNNGGLYGFYPQGDEHGVYEFSAKGPPARRYSTFKPQATPAPHFPNPAPHFVNPAPHFPNPAPHFVNPAPHFPNPAPHFVNPVIPPLYREPPRVGSVITGGPSTRVPDPRFLPGASPAANLKLERCGHYAFIQSMPIAGNGGNPVKVVRLDPADLAVPAMAQNDPQRSPNGLAKNVACAFFRMARAARTQGVVLLVESGFRSLELQNSIGRCMINSGMPECRGIDPNIREDSAGRSIFGMGTAVKIRVSDPRVEQWLRNNAGMYKFGAFGRESGVYVFSP